MDLLIVLLLLVCLLVWCLFFSKNQTIGRYLYMFNIALETRAASLQHVLHHGQREVFSYFTNNQATKPTMLLLHGFSADKSIWLKYAKFAKDDFNLIIPDLLGHGDIAYSENQNYSAFTQAEYVSRLLEQLNISGPVSIVGNSMGGMIAAILASQHNTSKTTFPVTVDKVALINPAGAHSNFMQQLVTNSYNPFSHNSVEEFIAFYKNAMHKPPFVPVCVQHFVAQSNYLSKKSQYQHMFSEFFNLNEFFETPFTINANKLVLIWGEEDKLLPVSEASCWEALLSCSCSRIPNIGHMPMVECPEKTYSLINI